jgi:hypothetical protein
MSHDFDDSALEEALRNDLPSGDTERRLRLRLLAAGVAVGNGVATTTAAAGTAAGGAAAATGVVGKVLGMSWGIKLGLAAAIAIPSVGLWLDRGSAAPTAARAVQVAAPAAPSASPSPAPAAAPTPIADAPLTPEPSPEPVAPRSARPAVAAEPALVAAAPNVPHPSQSDFAALDTPARAPQVGSTLADETRLLDAAFAAIGAGDRTRAAQLIQDHESRYPAGLLKKERERAKLKLSELSRGE